MEFSKTYTSSDEFNLKDPQQQAEEFLNQNNLFPKRIVFDGEIHRFQVGDKAGDDSGWYIFFDGDIPAGKFGNFKTGLSALWIANVGRELTFLERARSEECIKSAQKERLNQLEMLHSSTAKHSINLYTSLLSANDNHPYLQRKKVLSHFCKVTEDGRLVVPMYCSDGNISSLQFISASGKKSFFSGGSVKGCFASFGKMTDTIYICEGYATGATIYQETGNLTLIAFSASNLVNVAEMMRAQTTNRIIIVADNDKPDQQGVRAGEKYGKIAAEKIYCDLVMPPEEGDDINDFHLKGGNVKALLNPPEDGDDWLIDANEFCNQPSPVKYLVDGWIPEKSLCMIHGKSGAGKTFATIDIGCSIAAENINSWCGKDVANGKVVMLVGEGHEGLKGRIAVWKQHNNVDFLNMHISDSGVELDSPGGLQKAHEKISKLPSSPAIIIVDTLHCHMEGDENSSQDTGKMIRACKFLQKQFSCTVVLIHHTGNNNNDRARGSSAWKGALDSEISIDRDGETIKIVQKKNKDGEEEKDINALLKRVHIEGWYNPKNEPVYSLIIEKTNKEELKEEKKKISKIDEDKKMFELAWHYSACEVDDDGMPVLSKAAYLRYLIRSRGSKESTAQRYLSDNAKNGYIKSLMDASIISNISNNSSVIFKVNDSSFASLLCMQIATGKGGDDFDSS